MAYINGKNVSRIIMHDDINNNNLDQYLQDVIKELKSGIPSIRSYAFTHYEKLESVDMPFVTELLQNTFDYCSNLKSVNMPALTNISGVANFTQCTKLETINMPNLTTIGVNNFNYCKALKRVCFPNVTDIGSVAFQYCSALEVADFHLSPQIGIQSFYNCTALKALVLRGNSVARLTSTNALNKTPVGEDLGEGYIYVPLSLVSAYKEDTNWSVFYEKIRPVELITVDQTLTGEIDFSKI